MAMTVGIWGNPKTDRRCWWIRDGKMCLLALHYYTNRDASFCDFGHETTGSEERARKHA